MPHVPFIEVLPATHGISGAAMNGAITGNWIAAQIAGQLALEFDVINVGGLALPVIWYLETQRSDDGATAARAEMMSSDSGPAGGFITSDVYQRQWRYTTPAGAGTYRFFIERPITFPRYRIRVPIVVGAAGTDLLTVRSRHIF